jgi:hypothetical protein
MENPDRFYRVGVPQARWSERFPHALRGLAICYYVIEK